MKMVRSMISKQVESKYLDQDFQNVVPDIVTPTFHHLTPFATGVDQEERVGNRVRIQSIQLFTTFQNTDAAQQYHCRFMLYQRHGPYDNGPPLAAWYSNTNPDIIMPRKDLLFMLTTRNGGCSSKNVNYTRRWPAGRGPLVTFGNNTALGSQSGSWYLGVYSDQPGGTTTVSYTLRFRVWYKDG